MTTLDGDLRNIAADLRGPEKTLQAMRYVYGVRSGAAGPGRPHVTSCSRGFPRPLLQACDPVPLLRRLPEGGGADGLGGLILRPARSDGAAMMILQRVGWLEGAPQSTALALPAADYVATAASLAASLPEIALNALALTRDAIGADPEQERRLESLPFDDAPDFGGDDFEIAAALMRRLEDDGAAP